MPAPVTPNIIAKASLVTARAIDSGAEIPQHMTNSAHTFGAQSTNLVGAVNQTLKASYVGLKPRGPAAWLTKLFDRVDAGIPGSVNDAKRATVTFWDPFSKAAIQTGSAFSNPFALFYANRAGFHLPDDAAEAAKLLDSVKHPDPFVKWPVAEEPAPPSDGGDTPPPAEPPKDGGDTPPPTEPPKDGGDTPPPSEPPKDGGDTPPPAEPPKDGGDTPPPAEPPNDGGDTPPADPAPDGGGTTPPAEPPKDGGDTPPPTEPPTDGGDTPPPAEPPKDGGDTPPPSEPPTDGGGDTPPAEPPTDGGGSEAPPTDAQTTATHEGVAGTATGGVSVATGAGEAGPTAAATATAGPSGAVSEATATPTSVADAATGAETVSAVQPQPVVSTATTTTNTAAPVAVAVTTAPAGPAPTA
ncbi:MAG: hypothetical protein JWN41_1229 [Thermoleophilia bacterium]|nr:hypothetical protein [Thermoleophilia bacterium]